MWGKSLVRDSRQSGDYSRGLSDNVDIKIIKETDFIASGWTQVHHREIAQGQDGCQTWGNTDDRRKILVQQIRTGSSSYLNLMIIVRIIRSFAC